MQYLKDTRSELRHVAWPTQTQTIVYTLLVAAMSIGIALYLGLFDFIFTTGLTKVVNSMPSAAPVANTQVTTTVSTSSPQAATNTPLKI